MILRSLVLFCLGTFAFAYTPSAGEILIQMEKALRRADPVQISVSRENSKGSVLETLTMEVPADPETLGREQGGLDISFTALTLPVENISRTLPTVTSDATTVSLGRLEGKVCFVLRGKTENLWIGKDDWLPRKVEVVTPGHLGDTYLFLDMVKLSENVYYPSRTEVWRDGDLVLIERLLFTPAPNPEP